MYSPATLIREASRRAGAAGMAAGSARDNQVSMLAAACEDWSFAMETIGTQVRRACQPWRPSISCCKSACSTTVSEAVGRAAVDLTCGSSALVEFGFFAAATHSLAPAVAAVVPSFTVLGVFTFVRLVETSVKNMVYLRPHRSHPRLLRDA
jgi:hypothetical protein